MPHHALASAACTVLLTVAAVAGSAAWADPAPPAADHAVFEQLKSLAGRWEGQMEGGGAPASMLVEVTSGGHTVLERQFPGTAHEMVTVYYLAGGKLQATHYCAMGNQPAYTLAAGSTPQDIVMQFAGGTNIDVAKDNHANGERLQVVAPDRLQVEFQFRNGQEAPTAHRMTLTRASTPPAAAPAGK